MKAFFHNLTYMIQISWLFLSSLIQLFLATMVPLRHRRVRFKRLVLPSSSSWKVSSGILHLLEIVSVFCQVLMVLCSH